MDQGAILNRLINFANLDDTYQIKSILYETHQLNLLPLRNSKLYTLLHLSCYNDNNELTELYLNYIQAQLDNNVILPTAVRDYVNAQNDEGFTALHLASYRGNLKVVELLESYQADAQIVNYHQMTVLHTAAQGDSVLICCYFLRKGFHIDAVDNKGSTPLLWASFQGAYNSVTFLLSWGANINQTDTESGVSALHLATMQGNSRIARKLLMKGIDRNIKDFQGFTAYKLAIDQNCKAIAQMIENKIGILERCNIRQPFQPMKRNANSLIMFQVMYITCFILTIAFTFPYMTDTSWMYVFFGFTISTMCFFWSSWLTDPGIINSQGADMLAMLKHYDPSQICPDCKLVRPQRARHCDICHKCCKVYDHHCPWINNCVGAGNLAVFYFFILSLFSELIMQILLQAQNITHTQSLRFYDNQVVFIGKYVTFAYVLIYCIIFLIPIGILLYYQTTNIILGKSTFERHAAGHNDQKVATTSCWTNCLEMCYKNKNIDSQLNYIEL